MKWSGYVSAVRGKYFDVTLRAEDGEEGFATIAKEKLRAVDRPHLVAGAMLTITGKRIRFVRRRWTKAELARAEREAKKIAELFAGVCADLALQGKTLPR